VLDNLQESLAEAHGLAIAASTVMTRVEQLTPGGSLRSRLREMRNDAEETRARCQQIERAYGAELADASRAHAISIDEKVADLVNAWFKADTGPLMAWTFLAMTVAGEVATWRAISELAAQTSPDGESIRGFAAWAQPVHESHLELALEGSSLLGRMLAPHATHGG
jgi:hypothetical protein